MNRITGKLLVLLVLFIISLNAQAQRKFTMGFRLSVSKEFIDILHGDKHTFRLGFSIGGFGEYAFNKRTSLRAEVGILKTGYGSSISFTDMNGNVYPNGKLNIDLYYVNMPVLVKKYFGQKKLKPYYLLGGWLGIAREGNMYNKKSFDPINLTYSNFQQIHQNTIYSGLTGGIGIDWKPMFLEFKSNLALTAYDKSGTKISTIELGVGVRF